MGIIDVVCGVVYDEDKVFISRRKNGQHLSTFWEFPGGKIEKNETHHAALHRELMEEFEMRVNIIDFIGDTLHDYGDFQIHLFAYRCSLISFKGKLIDHDKFSWTEVASLAKFKMAPADIPILEVLIMKHLS